MQALLTVGLATGTAAIFGAMKGKMGPVELLGAPVDLLTGGIGLGTAAFGGFGRYANEGLAVSVGALCSYSHTLGAAYGARMGTPAIIAKLKNAASNVGALAQGSNQVSTNDVNDLVAAAARATGT
jgi:hypothetical protein